MRRRSAAFTLVELLVATVILGVVMVSVLGTMVTTQKKAASVEDTVDVQQTARQIADIIERDLRHTGMLVEDAASICGTDRRTSPDSFTVSNWEAVQPGSDLRPSLGAELIGATGLPANGTFFSVDSVVLEQATPSPAFDTDGNGVADSDFAVNGGVIVADAANPGRGAACGIVTGVNPPSQLRVSLDTGALSPVTVGMETPRIVAVPAIRYSVGVDGVLSRGGLPLAGDVEDLQLAWFEDADTDNVVDLGEYKGDGVGADYAAASTNASNLREIRLSIVLRTRDAEPELATGNPVATENRTVVAQNDGFRRRVYTSVVRLRNLGRRVQL